MAGEEWGREFSGHNALQQWLAQAEEEQFQTMLEENHLGAFPELHGLFDDSIRGALLTDTVLRPVFMVLLTEDQCSPPEVFGEASEDESDLEDLIRNHSVFLAGNAAIAREMIQKGYTIKVGVTDRYTEEDTLYSKHQVANGRQAYFPLPDGTWLGVKGCGQFIDESKPPHHWELASAQEGLRHMGIVTAQEAVRAEQYAGVIRDAEGEFVQAIGSSVLSEVPDGKGGFEPEQSFLVFNHVLTPHRLVKLPQLFRADPELWNIRVSISQALINQGILPQGTLLSTRELAQMITIHMARAEVFKQEKQVTKVTHSIQDITMGGREADNEEWVSVDEMIEQMLGDRLADPDLAAAMKEFRLPLANMRGKMMGLVQLSMLYHDRGIESFGKPHELFGLFFQSYFSELDTDALKIWSSESPLKGRSHPARLAAGTTRVDVLHEQSRGFRKQDEDLIEAVINQIVQLADFELMKREVEEIQPGLGAQLAEQAQQNGLLTRFGHDYRRLVSSRVLQQEPFDGASRESTPASGEMTPPPPPSGMQAIGAAGWSSEALQGAL
ncbi:MAG: hypothetical protein JW937_07545 [Candidatus Omnitrophica bacterium]|nr:hypothetical protein [Candidatus Omnitrophota bacterium]